jgi:hypothetical protein
MPAICVVKTNGAHAKLPRTTASAALAQIAARRHPDVQIAVSTLTKEDYSIDSPAAHTRAKAIETKKAP